MNITNGSTTYNRFSQTLPAIKGLAILMVVTYHLFGYSKGYLSFLQIWTESKDNGLKSIWESLLSTLFLIGEQGVHFFLIASGFGLAASWWRQYHSSEKNDRHFSVLQFWRRRTFRLLPLYWLAHILAFLLVLIKPDFVPYGKDILTAGGTELCIAIIASLTTLRNLIIKYYYFLNGAWWYIGLSIQLYLVFPLLVWCGKRWGWSQLLVGSLAFSLIYRSFIIALSLDKLTTDIMLRGALFPSRLFEFVFGIILAISLLQDQQSTNIHSFNNLFLLSKSFLIKRRWLGLHIFVWLLGLTCHWLSNEISPILRIPADALIGVGEFCLVFQIITWLKFLKKGLGILGNYSYGIFLTHMNLFVVFWTLMNKLVPFYWMRFAIVTAITCIFGGLFEFGYNWVNKKYLSSKSA
jgi:peptidoglycan/LPS O-acetylase OafA/YrhL